MTYATRTLTLSRPLSRFVITPITQSWNSLEMPRPSDSPSAPVRVSVFGKTDLGLTRDHNEDTFLVADLSTGNASLHPDVRDHEVGPRGSLFMVADGMGGAAAGELASAMAADIIYRHLSTAWTDGRRGLRRALRLPHEGSGGAGQLSRSTPTPGSIPTCGAWAPRSPPPACSATSSTSPRSATAAAT